MRHKYFDPLFNSPGRNSSSLVLGLVIISFQALLTTGCGVSPTTTQALTKLPSFQGKLHGGQQPVAGAQVFLYAAGTTGYASPARNMLDGTGYVTSDSSGNFSITGGYTCQSGDLVYLVASGGNPGLTSGTNNPALQMMAALGPCGNLTTSTFVNVNEISTVAAIWALSPFMTDASHIGTSSTNALGLTNSFATVGNLVDQASGNALAMTPAGNGNIPQAKINTLADILSTCINSDGTGSPCSTLMAATTTSGGTSPTNTLQAALNIAQNPTNSLTTLYGLQSSLSPFQPSLSSMPTDFTLMVSYSGGCMIESFDIAIDSQGNVWAPSTDDSFHTGCILKLSPTGSFLSGSSGFTGGTLSTNYATPRAIAIDLSDNAWISDNSQISNSVTKLNSSGTILSGTSGFVIDQGHSGPWHIAIDSQNNAWIANPNETAVAELGNDGTLLTGSSGFTGNVYAIGIDGLGNIWGNSSTNFANPNVFIKMNNQGVVQSGSAGFPIANLYNAATFAIDHQNNVWVSNTSSQFNFSIIRIGSSGATTSYTDNSLILPHFTAIDGLGHVWIGNSGGVVEMNSDGTFLSGPSGYLNQSTGSGALAIDASGNVWTADYVKSRIEQLIGVAAPVTTPIALAAKNNVLGTRP